MKFAIAFAIIAASVAFAAESANSTAELTDVTLAAQGCYWDGTAPLCEGTCAKRNSGWSRASQTCIGCKNDYYESERSTCGDGSCCWSGTKALCCQRI
ncbi:hypothetical protein GALMADRAFT_881437 [Galerina marginata CBS 339.88]|uniref:Uncharacterized protein n=1 Tax=Galerina marginata (strain CBS 339.88) TaxID=685588 RepID=A0A067SL02_GALM3|nr:hypothetical protein GALMADRAFT_881437 [Galerina marginata CBS 339.88]